VQLTDGDTGEVRVGGNDLAVALPQSRGDQVMVLQGDWVGQVGTLVDLVGQEAVVSLGDNMELMDVNDLALFVPR